MKKYISYASFLTLLLSPISAFAASCSNYPAVDGVEVIETLELEVRRDERFMHYLTVKLDKHAIAWAEKRRNRNKQKA